MLASEAIEKLIILKERFGDMRVCDEADQTFDEFEYVPPAGEGTDGAFVFGLIDDE